jgi:hypothetical protein
MTGMKPDEFEETLRELKYRKPFEPFVVELVDGRTINVAGPRLAFNEDGATYIGLGFELLEFKREEVRAIRPIVRGAVSNVVCGLSTGNCTMTSMNTEQFEDTMREFVHRQPFEPFVVELRDGRAIEVTTPEVAFHGDGAAFLTDDFVLVNFDRDDVRAIRFLFPGVTS